MIKLKKITKRYGDHLIFNDFDLDIDTGKMVALAGASGCGKTTLLNILGLLDMDYTGSVEIDDGEISGDMKNKTKYFRYTLGYLFQNFALADNLTVAQNLDFSLEYSKDTDKEKAKNDALASVGLTPDTFMKKKIFMLSGGEQQRVALARLILKPCKIILADEPTGSLDAINRDEVLKILRSLNKSGKTVIIVTHDSFVMDACDQVIHL